MWRLEPILYRLLRLGNLALRGGRDPTGSTHAAEQIVSDKYEFLYVGVPLCGTRTARELFVRHPALDYGAFVRRSEIGALLEANPRYARYFKFGFVRSPWSRVVSYYVKKVLNANNPGKIYALSRYRGLRPSMPFGEFVEWLCGDAGRDECADKHWMSQWRLLSDRRGRICCDFIGRLETMGPDLERVLRAIGAPVTAIPHAGASAALPTPHADYRKFYDARTAEMVARRYERDIELFGYEL